MTSPPSPPNRRRRRIVVTIVVLVLGLCWLFWPQRVDQRLVGLWYSESGITSDGTPGVVEIQNDGLAYLYKWWPDGRHPGGASVVGWQIHRGRLQLLSVAYGSTLVNWVYHRLYALNVSGTAFLDAEVVSLSESAIILREGTQVHQFRRFKWSE